MVKKFKPYWPLISSYIILPWFRHFTTPVLMTFVTVMRENEMKNKIIIKTCLMIVKWIDCNFLKKFLMPDSLIFDRYTGAISQPRFIQRLANCDHDQPQDVTWHEWVEPRCRGREGDVARCCKKALYTVYMGIFAQYQSCITVTVDITQGINFSYTTVMTSQWIIT